MEHMRSLAFDGQNNLHRILPGLHGLETLERFICYTPFHDQHWEAFTNFIKSRAHPLVVGVTHPHFCRALEKFLKAVQFYPLRFIPPTKALENNKVWFKHMNDRIQANIGFLQALKGMPERLPQEKRKEIYLASVGPWPNTLISQ
jgi:23S rRNA A1618 N6-methylase RlmF